jgi:hypothetical protein
MRSLLFEAPTIAGIAEIVAAQTASQQPEHDAVAAILNEVTSLSPEELQQLTLSSD